MQIYQHGNFRQQQHLQRHTKVQCSNQSVPDLQTGQTCTAVYLQKSHCHLSRNYFEVVIYSKNMKTNNLIISNYTIITADKTNPRQ